MSQGHRDSTGQAPASGMAGTRPLVVDAHQHHGFVAMYHDDRPPPDGWLATEMAARCAAMDRADIDRAVILPGNSYLRPHGIADTRAVNDGIAEYCRALPERFVAGAGVVEPLYGSAGLQEIRRIAQRGLIGVSYHARLQGVAADDFWIRRHLELIAELGLVPFVHTYSDSALESPVLIGELAATCPEITIVVLDGFGSYLHFRECLAVATRYENLVFDTSQAYSPTILREFSDVVGAHRLVFGSGIYSIPLDVVTRNTPTVLADAGYAGEELTALLGGTLGAILGAAAK